jgi:cholesterol oxidase
MSDQHFDTVVVGSGFGGSVTAYRLADGGQRVCVLERGKPYPPTSFARSPHDMARNFWDPSRGMHGLFNIWSFRGIEAVVSSGLGGGSLIYANVLLRKDERWFVHEQPFDGGYEHWPVTRADLDPHYDQVEAMLRPQRYPLGAPGYDNTAKTVAVRDAAQALGMQWELPNLAVTFANEGRPPRVGEPIAAAPYPNLHGPEYTRLTCRLSGECDLGCNYGSKNTLDHNYLSAAKHLGADIRTRCEVRRIEPRAGGGFSVTYVEHTPEQEGRSTKTAKLPTVTLTADRLVLASGTLGSTYLLLRNRSAFPHLSPALGTRFCGNGDMLGFMLRSHSGPDKNSPARVLDGSRGPVITSFVRLPDEVDPGGHGRGAYIEDAGFPGFVDWMLEAATAPTAARRVARFALRRIWAVLRHDPKSDLGGEIGNLLGTAELSAGSLPLLGMGRDVPDGVMKLRKGYLDVDWNMATSKVFFDRMRETMQAMATELGATYRDNPLSTLKKLITVHPLGGCPMGRHEGEGVVDSFGRAFNYPGLYVADGTVMPGPVGANPALTIAAFANRMAERILDDAPILPAGDGRQPVTVPPAVPDPPGDLPMDDQNATTTTSVEFTEEMKGYVTFGELDYRRGFEQGKRDKTFLMFHLTIKADDVDRFVADPEHEGGAVGWVECEALGGRLPVEQAVFNLFVDSADPTLKNMRYRLYFADTAGNPLTLRGHKNVKDDRGLDLWTDTSTLYTSILRGHVAAEDDAAAEVTASGIITIHLLDFARQLTTFRAEGPTLADRSRGMRRFGSLFLGELWKLYAPRAHAAAGTAEAP